MPAARWRCLRSTASRRADRYPGPTGLGEAIAEARRALAAAANGIGAFLDICGIIARLELKDRLELVDLTPCLALLQVLKGLVVGVEQEVTPPPLLGRTIN